MKVPLYFDWGVSTLYGWGIYGLNLLYHWPRVSGSPAHCIGQIQLEGLQGLDPLTIRALMTPLVESDQMRLKAHGGEDPDLLKNGVVLHSLGNGLGGSEWLRGSKMVTGATGAVVFFEDTTLTDAAEISRQYAAIVTGCSWCEEILKSRGVTNAVTAIQGIDPAIFHPAPRADLLAGRFAVFSGGKLEFRKGQDLVLQAFRAFAARHPEAILVTAWHSPWPIAALTLNGNPGIEPLTLGPDGKVDAAGWAAANGVPAEQFIDVGTIPNHQMARVLREMDVAVFPNRCEGGTNLVAMECMACGVPTIVSDNTGHRDLVTTNGTFPLTHQSPVVDATRGTEGWGESDIEEIVEALEKVWRDRAEAKRRADIAVQAMQSWSWHNQIGKLHDILLPFSP